MSVKVCRKVVVLGAVCCTLAGLVGAEAASTQPPRIEVGELIKDLGVITPGEKVDLVFKVANRGGEPLTMDVKSTCGCTVATWDREVEPGKTGLIKAALNTSGYSGVITKSIMVLTNDPETPTTRLTIKADLRPVLEILPRPLVRLSTTIGKPASATVMLAATAETGGEYEVTSVESAQPYLSAVAHRLDTRADNGQLAQYEITVALSEQAPPGFLNVPVIVHTTHPRAKEVSFKVVGTVRSSS